MIARANWMRRLRIFLRDAKSRATRPRPRNPPHAAPKSPLPNRRWKPLEHLHVSPFQAIGDRGPQMGPQIARFRDLGAILLAQGGLHERIKPVGSPGVSWSFRRRRE